MKKPTRSHVVPHRVAFLTQLEGQLAFGQLGLIAAHQRIMPIEFWSQSEAITIDVPVGAVPDEVVAKALFRRQSRRAHVQAELSRHIYRILSPELAFFENLAIELDNVDAARRRWINDIGLHAKVSLGKTSQRGQEKPVVWNLDATVVGHLQASEDATKWERRELVSV
jgi:hypothetical protein